jgi:hypothetical protein
LAGAAALTLSAAAAREAAAAPSPSTAAAKAVKYLRAHQQKAGGFADSGTSASQVTPWVIMAIRAAGGDPASWRRSGGRTTVQYLQQVDIGRVAAAGTPRNPAATYAKYILAYKALRRTDLIRSAGARRIDLVSRLLAYQDPTRGKFTTSAGGTGDYAAVSTTTYAILALKAAGGSESRRLKAIAWLKNRAHESGGYSWNPGSTPDVDSTGAAIQALRAGGVGASSNVVRGALRFMRDKQRSDGGFAYFSGGSTVESTSLAVMGIVAAGQDPAGSAWRRSGRSPIFFLCGKQAPNGSFYHVGTISSAPLLSTAYALIAIKKGRLPL